jgi:hypothetical protein
MTSRIANVLPAFAVVIVMAAPLGAQHDKHASTDVSGTWTMAVEGSPHGATTMGLTLRQDGKVVTGSFASPHGDMQVKGEFADGRLTLATVASDGASEITFKATLKGDGSLSGYLSSSMGDMTWTATRKKEKS